MRRRVKALTTQPPGKTRLALAHSRAPHRSKGIAEGCQERKRWGLKKRKGEFKGSSQKVYHLPQRPDEASDLDSQGTAARERRGRSRSEQKNHPSHSSAPQNGTPSWERCKVTKD